MVVGEGGGERERTHRTVAQTTLFSARLSSLLIQFKLLAGAGGDRRLKAFLVRHATSNFPEAEALFFPLLEGVQNRLRVLSGG
jgi:hypothetical protein